MTKNDLFNTLMSNLRNADSAPPTTSTLLLGFTKMHMATFNLRKPRLVWYDANENKFYDQGDSTKIKKSKWTKINNETCKRDKVLNNLKYYITIDSQTIASSNYITK